MGAAPAGHFGVGVFHSGGEDGRAGGFGCVGGFVAPAADFADDGGRRRVLGQGQGNLHGQGVSLQQVQQFGEVAAGAGGRDAGLVHYGSGQGHPVGRRQPVQGDSGQGHPVGRRQPGFGGAAGEQEGAAAGGAGGDFGEERGQAG